MIDIIIVGGGPAALSAAINARARNKSVTVYSGAGLETSSLYKAEKISNYLGFPSVTGSEMLNQFYNHAIGTGAEIIKKRILQIIPSNGGFALQADNTIAESRAVILATGIQKKAQITGERQFVGRGVSYCATCDGMLYRGKKVIVIGEIDEAEEDVNFLSEICSSVHFLPLYKNVKNINPKVTILNNKVTEIIGGDTVTGVSLKDAAQMECDGVFIIKESAPTESLIRGLATEGGHILVDSDMRTNIEGIFACGDCTGSPYQVAKAVSEGLVAGLQAAKFLS